MGARVLIKGSWYKSCSHDYYLRYLQQSVYRAPFYGLILQRALSANVTPSQPYARDE